MVPVLLALGANVGDPAAQILRAAQCLHECLSDFRLSRLVRSAPMYLQDQPEFINAVAIGMTGLDPRGLLAELKRIEQALGRLPREQNGPREIDLDIIAYGNLHYFYNVGGSTQLEVPHPRLKERRFVLQPLLDLVPSGEWPTVGRFDHLLVGDPLEIIEC